MGVPAGQFLPVPMKWYLFTFSVPAGALGASHVGSFTGIVGDGVGVAEVGAICRRR